MEFDRTPNALREELCDPPFDQEEGFVAVPTGPGLGIEFNEDLARAHPCDRTGLHLEMQDAACDWQNGNAFAGGSPE